jgi:hypothetical protein
MPTPRKYASNAERQAAYRTRCAASSPTCTPRTSSASGSRRWKGLIRHAHTLLATVAAEMAAYERQRSDAWHDSDHGERFLERSESLEEVLLLLHDLAEA